MTKKQYYLSIAKIIMKSKRRTRSKLILTDFLIVFIFSSAMSTVYAPFFCILPLRHYIENTEYMITSICSSVISLFLMAFGFYNFYILSDKNSPFNDRLEKQLAKRKAYIEFISDCNKAIKLFKTLATSEEPLHVLDKSFLTHFMKQAYNEDFNDIFQLACNLPT